MTKRTTGWVILLSVGVVIFVTAIYVVIPKAAGISLPFRWNSIPLQQKRTLVLQYFGTPADSTVALTDKWVAKRSNGEYVLKMRYTQDSVADSYQLYFDYKLFFFTKEYLLEEK